MNHTLKFCAAISVSLFLSACEPGTGSGMFPSVSDVVLRALPRALSGSRSSAIFENAGAPLLTRASCSSYSSSGEVFSCAATRIFPTSQPADNLASWFLFGIDKLDTKFSALSDRYNGLAPLCDRKDPAAVLLEIDGVSFSDLATVSIPTFFNCYSGDDLSWGEKDSEKYFMHRSFGEGGTSAGSTRIVTVVKMAASENEVEAWMLLNSSTTPTPSIARLRANKVSGAFAFELRLGHNDAYFKQMYLRTSSNFKMYFTALGATGSAVTVDNCVSSRDYTATMSGCTSEGLATFPTSTFSSPPALAEVNVPNVLYTAIDQLVKIDMAAKGVPSGD